jgi:hypothetical protein
MWFKGQDLKRLRVKSTGEIFEFVEFTTFRAITKCGKTFNYYDVELIK